MASLRLNGGGPQGVGGRAASLNTLNEQRKQIRILEKRILMDRDFILLQRQVMDQKGSSVTLNSQRDSLSDFDLMQWLPGAVKPQNQSSNPSITQVLAAKQPRNLH